MSQETPGAAELAFSEPLRPRGQRARAVRLFFRKNPVALPSILLVTIPTIFAIFAPLIATHDPEANGPISEFLMGPSWDHLFGTDRLGRDTWSRVVYGARPAMIVGLSAVLIGVSGGLVIGMLSGYLRGWVEQLLQRAIDVALSIPNLILLLIAVAIFQPSLRTVSIAIGVFLAPAIGRVTHGIVVDLASATYVEAAEVVGAGRLRILGKHLLPNVLPPVIVISSAVLPAAILAEAGLSFLGLGVPPPAPSWGADLSGQNRSAFIAAPWLFLFPGAALSLTVLGFNLLGDVVRDVLDPRLRGQF